MRSFQQQRRRNCVEGRDHETKWRESTTKFKNIGKTTILCKIKCNQNLERGPGRKQKKRDRCYSVVLLFFDFVQSSNLQYLFSTARYFDVTSCWFGSTNKVLFPVFIQGFVQFSFPRKCKIIMVFIVPSYFSRRPYI